MPTRCIKLKLVIPRGDAPEAVALRRALWRTHKYVNEAVAYYEELLLDLRQGDVCVGRDDDGHDVVRPAEHYQERLRARLRERGIAPNIADEALPALARLYQDIIPSAEEGEKGNAQAATGFLSLLVDPESQAGEANNAVYERWRPLFDAAEPERVATARLIAQDPAAMTLSGSPPGWLRQYKKAPDDDTWVATLHGILEEKLAPQAEHRASLKARHVFPLARPFCDGRLVAPDTGVLNKIDRAAFALAAAHLNSWESWGYRARAELAKRQGAVADWEAKYGDSHRDAVVAIEQWQAEHEAILRADALWTSESRYRLRPRELRLGWTRLREWLKDNPSATKQEREDKVHALQTELGRDFGSERVLKWLSDPERQFLSTHREGDVVARIAAYNLMVGVLERTRAYPVFTHAEAQRHPRFMQLDSPANSNSPQFDLIGVDGRQSVTLPLLFPSEEQVGLWVEQKRTVPLAASGQLAEVQLKSRREKSRKHLSVNFRPQDGGELTEADVGGGSLLFSRAAVGERLATRLEAGDIGPVWLKVTLDLPEPASALVKARREFASKWLKPGPDKRKKNGIDPTGRRVLAIDLGLRSAACGAVYEVGRTDKPEALRVGKLPLVHERSFRLVLPGEDVRPDAQKRRDELDRRLREIRASISHLKTLRRACRASTPEGRTEAMDWLSEVRLGTTTALVRATPEDIDRLRGLLGDEAAFASATKDLWFTLRGRLAVEIKSWRREGRATKIKHVGGKTAWAVEYLERVRKTLVSWRLLPRPDREDIRRLDRDKQGTVAKKLLGRVNALKEDRVKTTADLIVQAARGLVYDPEKREWQMRHKPVDVILLEDLSRYRFRTDRPRAENGQLMRWSHREVARQVIMQAQPYGIAVFGEDLKRGVLAGGVPAAFSSRFDAITRAPGIRCEAVTRERLDFYASEKGARAREELGKHGIDTTRLRLGDVVPRDGGELFASVGPSGVRVRHADINAAQNLGLRQLEAFAQPNRVVAFEVAGSNEETYVSRPLGVYAEAAFGGKHLVLRRVGRESYRHEVHGTPAQAARAAGIHRNQLAGGSEDDDAKVDEGDLDLAEAQADLDDLSAGRVTFFRDPSGTLFGGAWLPAKAFWGAVKSTVVKALKQPRDGGKEPFLHQ